MGTGVSQGAVSPELKCLDTSELPSLPCIIPNVRGQFKYPIGAINLESPGIQREWGMGEATPKITYFEFSVYFTLAYLSLVLRETV